MVARGNVDKHRTTYSGGVKAVEEQKWGRAKAEERYGPLQFRDGAPRPPDKSMPEAPEYKRGPDWADNTAKDWRIGFGKGGTESAEGKPNFDRSKK